MKRVTKGHSGEDIPLFASMITASETSPSRITSSPSLSPQHTPFTAPSTSQPSNIHTTPVTKEAASMSYESPLQSVYLLGHDEGKEVRASRLLKNMPIFEEKKRRKSVVLTDEKEVSEDPSKQGRKIQEKISNDTEVLLEQEETAKLVEEPTELVEDQGSSEKGEQEVTTADTALNTASIPISTANATPEVSTAAANLVYIRRSAEKRKDKGKAVMIEDESINEEERKRIARDAKIGKQLQEEYDKTGKKEAVAEVNTTHVIDWNDPSVI
ncbi:hypothetical protein Tco_1558699, partial [Tanacetum coccineum]